jgi:hypothetical protein
MDASQATVTVTFDTPFAYNGGNLLLDIQTKTRGNDKDSEFLGLSTSSVLSVFANGFGGGQPGTSGSGESFLPKTMFAYTGEVSAPCVKPANLKADSVAPDYAAVSWTAGGEETQWQAVCMAGNAAADWSGAVLVNEPKAAFANLQPTSDYTIYVRSYCAEDKQSFAESITIHTACGKVTELPWSEDFSNADALACWELQNANVRIFSGALMFGLNGADSLVAAMPEFDAAYDTLALTFNYNTNSYNATLELGYISAEDAFVALGDAYPKTKNYTLVEDVLLNTVPAAAKRLAFRYAATEASYVYVDNITLKVAPEEVVTAIEQTEAGVKAVKRIENGQLVIIKNGVRFNVLGSAL